VPCAAVKGLRPWLVALASLRGQPWEAAALAVAWRAGRCLAGHLRFAVARQ